MKQRKFLYENLSFPVRCTKRTVRTPLEKGIAIDPTGKMPGRGAYGFRPGRSNRLGQARARSSARSPLDDAFYEELLEYVRHQKPDAMVWQWK